MESTIKSIRARKGIILTIDSIIAITLVAIILITATNYVARSEADVLPELQSVRTGYDILTLLDNTNSFEDMDMNKLKDNLDGLLTSTYDMKIKLILENGVEKEILVQEMPLDRFIGTGERVFSIEGDKLVCQSEGVELNERYICLEHYEWMMDLGSEPGDGVYYSTQLDCDYICTNEYFPWIIDAVPCITECKHLGEGSSCLEGGGICLQVDAMIFGKARFWIWSKN